MFDLSAEFENIYKMDYEFGWVGKQELRSYVSAGYLSAAGYERITGEAYEQATQQA